MNRGGVVFRAHGQLHFLPALVVQHIVPLPPITRVPDAPRGLAGVAHAEGEVVPVIDLADDAPNGEAKLLIVCSFLGEPMGVLGDEVVGVGHYDVDPSDPNVVLVGMGRARPLDLGTIYARIQGGG